MIARMKQFDQARKGAANAALRDSDDLIRAKFEMECG